MEYMVNVASSSGARNHEVSKEISMPPSQGSSLKDRFSDLPAEIVVDILSKLKAKESVSTSVLSRTWRHMWTTIYNLDFDGSEILDDSERKIKCFEVERPIYVSCINQVVTRHQGQSIDQFAVVFRLDASFRSDIDRWVSFAVRKRVQRLKLDLGRLSTRDKYSFPDSLEISSLIWLKDLHLANVDINGEMLELFLNNCLNLEGVFVRDCPALITLNVNGSSLKLKWLELRWCQKFKSLNVSAPNLVSFKYSGPKIPVPFKDVPKLVEVSIRGMYSYYINSHLHGLFRCLSQLEMLTIGAWIFEKHMKAEDVRFPVFPKLKHLTLAIDTYGNESMVDYVSLINACPHLHYFTFENRVNFKPPRREPFKGRASTHNIMIRVVEFKGFCGNAYEVEMAEYLIENAVMLEKITFDAMSPVYKGKWLEFHTAPLECEILGRECARELGKRLRSSVELVIIV